MKDLKNYWDKTKNIRASLPNLIRPNNVFDTEEKENEEEKSITQRINDNLLKYKEIKLVYKKTGISPAYYLYLLVACLFFIFIGYFDTYLTHLIGTLFPIYISIKTLKNSESTKDDTKQWLTYWYKFFYNN